MRFAELFSLQVIYSPIKVIYEKLVEVIEVRVDSVCILRE